MFKHRPVTRDTSVLHEIITVCCESVRNCKTQFKVGRSQVVNNFVFLLFFSFSLRPMALVSYLFLSRSEVWPPRARVLYIVFILSIDSSLYHATFSHVTVFSVFFGESKVKLCDPQCEFLVLIYWSNVLTERFSIPYKNQTKEEPSF